MSLVEKFAEGSKVRTYKRGVDNIDFNEAIRLAESGFYNWITEADIRDEYKDRVEEAYRHIITKMIENPESFVIRPGGGFNNTLGITNEKDEFDAYGIAAGYIGNIFRGMPVYTIPTVESIKMKYDKNKGLVTSLILNLMWGENPINFVMLDDPDSTGIRGLNNRITSTITGLENLREHLDDYYDFNTPEDKLHAINRINSTISILLNPNPNDDWFALELIGMSEMEKFFYTGKNLQSLSPLFLKEQEAASKLNRIRSFENWMSNNRPLYMGLLQNPISIDSLIGTATLQLKDELRNRLGSLSNDEISDLLLSYIVNPNYDLSLHPIMRKLYGGLPLSGTFTNSLYITGVLELAVTHGKAINIPNTYIYYLPDTLEEYPDKSSTVYVYDSLNLVFEQVDTQDIEDYRKLYMNEYLTANPQQDYTGNLQWSSRYSNYGIYKEGGVLKAKQGIKFNNILDAITYLDEDLTDEKRLRNLYSNGNFSLVARTTPATDEINSGNNQYDPELGGPELELQEYYKNWLNILTSKPKVAEAYARRYRALLPTTNVHYQSWFNSDDSFNFLNFINSTVNNKKVYNDAINGIGHDFYRGRVYQMVDLDGNPIEGYYNALLNGYELVGDPELDSGNLAWIYKMRKVSDDSLKINEPYVDEPYDGSNFNEVTGDDTPYTGKSPESPGSNLEEKRVKKKEIDISSVIPKQGYTELPEDLLRIKRYLGHVGANNEIDKTLTNPMEPNYHSTWEENSPVLGAFDKYWLKRRLGAKGMFEAYHQFTSDPSLVAARMGEGLIARNDLEYQGLIADDEEIRRTSLEALRRLEENAARRTEVANYNRDAIIKNNNLKALVEATRIKANLASKDLLEKEFEMLHRLRRERKNRYLLLVGQLATKEWRLGRLNLLLKDYRTWRSRPGNESKTLSDFNDATGGLYEQALASINSDYALGLLMNYGAIYGENLSFPYNHKPYSRNKYDLLRVVRSSKNGGKLNSTLLIDKIIKENESNS